MMACLGWAIKLVVSGVAHVLRRRVVKFVVGTLAKIKFKSLFENN